MRGRCTPSARSESISLVADGPLINVRGRPGSAARITCLVEAGTDYGEPRGVVIYGTVRLIEDYPAVVEIGSQVVTRTMGVPGDAVAGYAGRAARKKVAYVAEPVLSFPGTTGS